MATKKVLVLTLQKKVMTETDKVELTALFEPLITDYKKKFIEAMPNKKNNYISKQYKVR